MGNKAQKTLAKFAAEGILKEVPRDHAFSVEFLSNTQANDSDGGEHNEYLIKVTTMPN